MYTCAMCTLKGCEMGECGSTPKNCPGIETEQEEIKNLYSDEENRKLAYSSALTESKGYCEKTRLEEIMDFARRCGFAKLGLAFCGGLRREAEITARILMQNGFEVNSVVCKNSGTPKEFLGIRDEDKVRPGTFEPICNPIGQAVCLNKAGTELNIILGLCVGHDSLFMKHSEAPVTVFAVKDRVLAHNPLGAVYLADSYYKSKLSPSKK